MPGATVPSIGALSSDCGSTFHPLIKAQRTEAGEAGKDDGITASFSATDCPGVSVKFKPPKRKSASIQEAIATKEF